MKITNRSTTFQQPEVESRAEKYKGPDSVKQDKGIEIPDNVLDTFENVRSDGNVSFGPLENIIQDAVHNPSAPTISSRVHEYKGPDFFEVAQPTSKVSEYKGPKTIPGTEKGSDRFDADIVIPDSVRDSLTNDRRSGLNPFNRLEQTVQAASDRSSEEKIVGKVNEYKGPDSLKTAEIESPVNQYKGPKRIG